MGYAYQGQECPPQYSAYNTVEWLGGGASGLGLHYGPNMYCQSVWSVVDIWHDKPGSECGAGNPIFPLTGAKRQSEDMLRWSPTLPPLSITYDNRRKLPNSDPEGAFSHMPSPSFGNLWESNAHKRFAIQVGNSSFGSYYTNVQASRGSGTWVSFIRKTSTGEPQAPDSDIADRVGAISGGWRYVDARAQSLEAYAGQGELTSVAYARGNGQTYSYSDSNTPVTVAPTAGLLIRIQDPFGRAVRFEYEQPAGVAVPRIVRIIDPDGQVIQAGYDAAGNLSQLNWPDGHMRKFLYEQGALPWALTGIIDENGERHSTYAYDGEGRAVSTEYAGGVNRYSLSYGSPPRWVTKETFDATLLVFWRDHNWQLPQDTTLTTPTGTAVNLGATLINGMPRTTTRNQPAGAGCDAASSTLTYDANGNVSSRTGFDGVKSCHAYDLSRNLETAQLQGLRSQDACPADISAQSIAAETSQRKTTTQWHPDWSLEVKHAEPGMITTSVYNGQPDPTAGNALASCAPASAVLPDGKPIAALCKKIQQSTSDSTGALSFAATPTGPARTWAYTYNQDGQMLTMRDPLNQVTSYAYYSDTTDEHTKGDLQSVTNAFGHVTRYTQYDKSGRLLRSADANGAQTQTAYTPRGWVRSVSVTPAGGSAQVYTYGYDGAGQLKEATLPDGAVQQYTYDAAHRLTGVKDSGGNTVSYTLDNMGNRIGEQLNDPAGVLTRNITRVFDALNRLQNTTGNPR